MTVAGWPDAKSVRKDLVQTIERDLIGPDASAVTAEDAAETLAEAPSKWYLTGFLAPRGLRADVRAPDADEDEPVEEAPEVLDAVEPQARGPGDDEPEAERLTTRRLMYPSSLGLSVLVPAKASRLVATASWGHYEPQFEGKKTQRPRAWQRVPQRHARSLPVHAGGEPRTFDIPEAPGVKLVLSVRPLETGVRAVSVFLVNARVFTGKWKDQSYLFQAKLSLTCAEGFVPRSDPRGASEAAGEADDRIAALQYRDTFEFAVGHNVSATAIDADGEHCSTVATTWMPTAEVPRVEPAAIEGVTLGIEALAAAADAEALQRMLAPLPDAYARWIKEQGAAAAALKVPHDGTARSLLQQADLARERIAAGIERLANPQHAEAFKLANRVIATAMRQRSTHGRPGAKPEEARTPEWRPFQLAFILLNLPGITSAEDPHRETVDLLFFPTGGGKTEAYLGLAAYALALRRLRDPTIKSAGVSVLMRYTLRLLTLDQLGRAATMICALELERQRSPERLGPWPFEIGLWVGSASTPNRMGEEGDNNPDSARARTQAYKRNPTGRSAPIPIEACPWCGTQFSPQSFTLLRDGQKNDRRPTDLRVNCVSRYCDFSERRQPSGLPLVTVDEPIYLRLPCFLIATVDKFANLPWNGQTAGFFGLVERYDERQGFYTAGAGQGARPLPGGLPPPDLIIQDELHLISGPLGTMVGLYEAAMDGLCRHGGRPPAKIVASTATVRRAERQIQALFGRTSVAVFPPPGPDRRDSFFARTVGVGDKPGRLYVGLAAQGRNPRVLLLRTCLSIMSRALAIWSEAGGEARVPNPADPYMTVLGYFNALRELGGSRRIIEDELTSRLKRYGKARRRPGETEKRFANRVIGEPHELTSRRDTSQVAGTKHRLGIPYKQKDWLDFALATNMISVGLDITRLGLLVMMGQPKSASEYIQATSRVGREAALPGLVVTLLNVHKPRDRSYFERFATWHASFYRAVEATSVTPFAPRAVDRGLVGVTVALARLGIDALRPPRGVQAVERERTALRSVVDQLVRRAILCSHGVSRDEEEELRARIQGRVTDLLDAWVAVVRDGPPNLEYAAEETGTTAFLHQPLDPHARSLSPMEAKFKAPRSLRDVEPSVPLFVRRPDGREIRDEEAL